MDKAIWFRRTLFKCTVILLTLIAGIGAFKLRSALVRTFMSDDERRLLDLTDRLPTIEQLYGSAHKTLWSHIDSLDVNRSRQASESILRFLGLKNTIILQEQGHEKTGHRYAYDPLLGWRNIPDWKATTGGKKLTINSKGLRDKEYSYDKKPGTKRVLVLGDSFAWGYGVADDEIFTEVLERMIAAHGDTPPVEVINTGVSGWGTDQQYLYLISEGYKYSPGLVLLAFYIENDPVNNSSSRQYGLYKPLFASEKLNLMNVPVPLPSEETPVQTCRRGLQLTGRLIVRMAQFCKSIGARFVLMPFGGGELADRKDENNIRRVLVESLLEVEAALLLDLDREFDLREVTESDLQEGNNDGHWNAWGHNQVGAIVLKFLMGNNLL